MVRMGGKSSAKRAEEMILCSAMSGSWGGLCLSQLNHVGLLVNLLIFWMESDAARSLYIHEPS
jgi:hypothetical protein